MMDVKAISETEMNNTFEEGEDEEETALIDERNSQLLDQSISFMFRKLIFNELDYPSSYKSNNFQEEIILSYVENFNKQYHNLYPKRKPLFLKPQNEFNIPKFVCSTMRPMELPIPELNDWRGASEFVSDHLIYVPLNPSYELPDHLYSPATVLKYQRGHCFEYSTLLASLLIGVGYDAYVVSGYATRETCLIDQTLEECPLLKTPPKLAEVQKERIESKYRKAKRKSMKSRYETMMERKQLKILEEELQSKVIAEQESIRRMELPAEDALYALRCHSWVLVLSGARDVEKEFFIEPTTGLSHPIDHPQYLGVEQIWNDQNVWVCMQDCSEGVKDLNYSLKNGSMWEYILLRHNSIETKKPSMPLLEFQDAEEDLKEITDVSYIDLSPSWVLPLVITDEAFKKRCPDGKKVTLYKKSKLEKFAPYLMRDGLVQRLSIFEDYNRTKLIEVRETYQHRMDKLHDRVYNYEIGWTYEYFHPGRPNKLKEHHFKSMGDTAENQRTSIFYSASRPDSLLKRVETTSDMMEYFDDRDDYLYYKLVEYGIREKKFGPIEVTPRKIEKIVLRYRQNRPDDVIEKNVAEITYGLLEDKVIVIYHREENRVTATVREFIKPSKNDEKGKTIIWNPVTNYSVYMSDPLKKDKKKVALYNMMLKLLEMQDRYGEMTRESEMEVQVMLEERMQEETNVVLEISLYDAIRSDKAKKRRAMLERQAQEEKLAKEEKELDILSTFIPKEKDIGSMDEDEIEKLKEEILEDMKQRLTERANLIQSRYDKEISEMTKKQLWFQQNQMTISKEDEHEYINYCNEAAFRIRILEMRLKRHESQAPNKFNALKERLSTDPRLNFLKSA